MSETESLQAITSSTLINRRDLLFLWASQSGASFTGGEGELDLLKKITKAKGFAGAVGNFSETDCLRAIVVIDGTPVNLGAKSQLDCLVSLAAASGDTPDPEPEIQDVADEEERLSLPANTAVGTKVHQVDNNTVYQLNAPSTAITAVNVAEAGTTEVEYIYSKRGTFNGKDYYNLLVAANSTTDLAIIWTGSAWKIQQSSGAGVMYSSNDAVARPDLVTTWTVVNGALPVPTVTGLQQGQLDAGATLSEAGTDEWNGVFPVAVINQTGIVGTLSYGKLGENPADDGTHNIYFPGGAWVMFISGDDNYYSTESEDPLIWDLDPDWAPSNGTPPAPTVTRNDVAATANWSVVP